MRPTRLHDPDANGTALRLCLFLLPARAYRGRICRARAGAREPLHRHLRPLFGGARQ